MDDESVFKVFKVNRHQFQRLHVAGQMTEGLIIGRKDIERMDILESRQWNLVRI